MRNGAGEMMVQQLRALDAFAEDLGSDPGTCCRYHTYMWCADYMYTKNPYTERHTFKNLKKCGINYRLLVSIEISKKYPGSVKVLSSEMRLSFGL